MRTISLTPDAANRSTSALIDSIERLLNAPRTLGMIQNVQPLLQPSAIFTYAL